MKSLSRYAHIIPISDGVAALYHALTLKVVFVSVAHIPEAEQGALSDRSSALGLLELDKEEESELQTGGFLVSENRDEEADLRRIIESEVRGVDISLMYLLLTDACNARCDYCFMLKGCSQRPRQFMSMGTARRALDAFCAWRNQDLSPTIQIYGGEPLLNLPALETAIAHSKRCMEKGGLPPDTRISVLCNGTLVTPQFVQLVKENRDLVSVAISMDGPKEIHDAFRPLTNGKGSFDKAMEGFNLLREQGVEPSLSVTLPPPNLDRIDEIVDWLLELRPIGLSFNTLTDVPGLVADMRYANHAAKTLIHAFTRFREAGMYEDRMMRKVRSFVAGKRYLKDCCGYGQQLVIAPNGDIGPCHGYAEDRKYFVANVNNLAGFDPRTDPTFLSWSLRSPLSMEGCQACECLGICGGGCANNADRRHGSMWAIDDTFCPHAKCTLRWMLAELYINCTAE